MPKAGIVAAVSRSHFDAETEAFLARLGARFGEVTRLPSGSAIKFCRVAEGAADIYPRLAPTHQWDVAAGHAVAGGRRRHRDHAGAEAAVLSAGRWPAGARLHRLGRSVSHRTAAG